MSDLGMRGMMRCFLVLFCQQLPKIKIRTYSVSNKLQETTCGCDFFPWNRDNRCRCRQAKKEPLERERMEEERGQWFVMSNPKQAICPAVATGIAVWKLHETPIKYLGFVLRCFFTLDHAKLPWNHHLEQYAAMLVTFSKHRTNKIKVIWRYHSLSFCIMKPNEPWAKTSYFPLVWLFNRDPGSLYIIIMITRWWFQICFIFTPTWGNDPIWLICFKGVETTNQTMIHGLWNNPPQ